MVTRELKPILKKVKALVLEGQRGQAIADSLGIGKTTVYNYINQLVFMGELIDVTGNNKSTPRVYEDGRARTTFNNNFDKSQTIDDKDISKRVVGSSKKVETSGRPDKVVRFHCTGCYDVPVIVLGNHAGPIYDASGYTVGQWGLIQNCNGSLRQCSFIRLYPGEDLKFTLYHAKAGPKLTVTPNPRDVYYKTADKVGPKELAEQVYNLLDLLTAVHGWQFGQPVYKGTDHYALTSDDLAPLLKYADRHLDIDNARVHVDTSTGAPEIEIYDDHDGAIEDVITLYELPERIDSITASLTAVHGTLRILASNMEQLTTLTAQLLNNQAETIKSVSTGQYAPPNFDNTGYR